MTADRSIIQGLLLIACAMPGAAQLLENLQSFGQRIKVDDVSTMAVRGREGPKDIVTADFDGDGKADFATSNLDATVSVVFGMGGGEFEPPVYLATGGTSTRGLVAADFNEDAKMDLAVVDPFKGELYVFLNEGGRQFAVPVSSTQWVGARAVVSGDFNGDSHVDLALAGAHDSDVTNGLHILLGDGAGGFDDPVKLQVLHPVQGVIGLSSRPVQTLAVFRRAGETMDSLVYGHAVGSTAWIYRPDIGGDGEFQMTLLDGGGLAIINPFDFKIGNLAGPTASRIDLVGISKKTGLVQIFQGEAQNGPTPWSGVQPISLRVPGGPRAVEIADVNHDGWNDLVVVLRNHSRVVVFENRMGNFELVSELPTGSSPRDVVAVSLNEDDFPDFLVMNRTSLDVSVLLSNPGQGSSAGVTEQTYAVDGQVVGLKVLDLNGDSRDDVIQLHAASGDVSVRLANDDGTLANSTFYPVGLRPIDFLLVDVNDDDVADLITANLGDNYQSSLGVRLGAADGTFGDLLSISDEDGRLFALEAGDFDGDGKLDLAVGYFDCRVVFYQGDGEGNFTRRFAHEFTYEARAMTSGDFDQDGDLDLAGSGAGSDVVVFENQGDFMAESISGVKRFDIGGKTEFPSIVAKDLDGDGDLDLTVGTSQGFVVLAGGEGASFTLDPNANINLPFPTNDSVVADFDGDEVDDLASACRLLSCVTILQGTIAGLEPILTVDVPSSDYIASGDIDGDGQADLVGTGNFLWVALSGPPPFVEAQLLLNAQPRPKIDGLVINEILASNQDISYPTATSDFTPDLIELYNGTDRAIRLDDMTVRLESDGGTNQHVMTGSSEIEPGGYFVILFGGDEVSGSAYNGRYKLPASGGIISLINDDDEIVDRVEYPATNPDVSWARFQDGFDGFFFNAFPDPGASNLDNGGIDPDIDFDGVPVTSLLPGEPFRMVAKASDDFGIFTLTMNYRIFDSANPQERSLLLFDDGQHDDGAANDGLFANVLPEDLPVGTTMEFFFTAVDLMGGQASSPGSSIFFPVGIATEHHKMRIGESIFMPGLQISEVTSKNKNGVVDEQGNFADWIEVRNTSDQSISLSDVYLTKKQFADDEDSFAFPEDTVLQPGEYAIVFADKDPEDGPFHAPFRLAADGEEVFLISRDEERVETILSFAQVPALDSDISWSRLGQGQEFFIGTPTPDSANGPPNLSLRRRMGDSFLFFPTDSSHRYVLEGSSTLLPDSWSKLLDVQGDGIEQTFSDVLETQKYYRLREQP